MSRLRPLILLASVLALAIVFAACGGSSDSTSDSGASSENPQTVLDQTFNPKSQIHSADIDATFDVSQSGSSNDKISAELSGPVEGNGNNVPKFDLTAKLSGSASGQDLSFEGGATSTGDAAYITYGGNSYALDSATFGYLQQAFQSSSSQQTQSSGSLKQFEDVLTNLKNEGTEDVEGTSSIHVSGDVDVKKLIDAIRPFASQAQSLGTLAPGASVPTPQDLDKVEQYVTGATFDVYSGADDHLLRKLDASIEIDDPQSSDKATIDFSLTLGKVNESQDISAPSGAKPLSDLVGPGGLSGLLGGAALGASGGTSPSGGTSVPGISSAQTQCLQSATTSAQIQACLTQ